jgi:hypothetical protein
MTIATLIKKLQKYENQKAKVLITVGTEDNDSLSTSDFVCFSDTSADGYVELFINEETCKKQM